MEKDNWGKEKKTAIGEKGGDGQRCVRKREQRKEEFFFVRRELRQGEETAIEGKIITKRRSGKEFRRGGQVQSRAACCHTGWRSGEVLMDFHLILRSSECSNEERT